MYSQGTHPMKNNFVTSIVTLLAATATLAAIAPSASAGSFVPQEEGEIDVDLGTALTGDYIDLTGTGIASVVSETDASTGSKSRLFVDKAGTDNTYGDVEFDAKDIGTSDGSGDYWFRPVAFDANGTDLLEGGQLEVGPFTFNFEETIKAITLSFFDTEGEGTSFSANGTEYFVEAGKNKNVQEFTVFDVSSLTVNLGEAGAVFKHGDGVNLQIGLAAVPEPATALGLMVAAGLSTAALKRKQKAA